MNRETANIYQQSSNAIERKSENIVKPSITRESAPMPEPGKAAGFSREPVGRLLGLISRLMFKPPSEPCQLIVFICGLLVGMVVISGPLIASSPATAANPSGQIGKYLAGRLAQNIQDPRAAIEFYRAALESDPGNLDIQIRVFSILVSEGRIKEALPIARKLAKLESRRVNLATLLLVLREVRQKNYNEAMDQLNSLPDQGFTAFTLPLLKAWVLAGQKKYAESLAVLKTRMSNPGVVALFGPHAALILERSGELAAAETQFKDALRNFRILGLGMTRIVGSFYERIGKADEARELYETFLRNQPGSSLFDMAISRVNASPRERPARLAVVEGVAEALFSLSRSLHRQNPMEAMIFSQLAIYTNPNFSIAKLRLGDALLSEDRIEDAIAVYESISEDPGYGWAARLRIARSYNFLNQLEKGAAILKKMAMERKGRIDALVTLGDIYRRRMKYQDAANAFNAAKKRVTVFKERHWQLLYWNAASHERLKKWPVAERDFLKALELRPDEPTILNYLGYSWVEQGKNLDRARRMIENAVRQMPQAGYIVDSLGWVQYRLGDIPGAVKNLERAVLLSPGDPTINEHLGDAYWKAGRKLEARFQWEKALSLEPEKDQIPAITRKLKDGLPET